VHSVSGRDEPSGEWRRGVHLDGPHPADPRALNTSEGPEQARSYTEAARHAVDAGFGTFWGVEETEIPDLYAALLAELARFDLAYVHLEATAEEEILVGLRRAWPGSLIMNPVVPMGPEPGRPLARPGRT
jgi:hypothetical protein